MIHDRASCNRLIEKQYARLIIPVFPLYEHISSQIREPPECNLRGRARVRVVGNHKFEKVALFDS